MRQRYDSGYKELLEDVRAVIPSYYAVLTQAKYPDIKAARLYNIMNHGTQDWDALRALADVLGVKEKEIVK